MATTTPNFGWSVPTSSDLVKNGAVAIETLGDSIDASLVDLKGGTTGQVLAKASNTDMDFVWAADAGAPESLGFTAGKNKIINGDFSINQRGLTSTTAQGYGFDRWSTGNSGGTVTYSSQAFTPGTAPVTGYEAANFARLVTSGQSAAGNFAYVFQRIEDVRSYANQTITVSLWAKASTGTPNLGISIEQFFGSGGSSDVVTSTTPVTISSSWARYSVTVAIPSISGKTIGTGSSLGIGIMTSAGTTISAAGYPAVGVQNVTIDFWGVQAEAGSTATAFQTATGTIQGELAACQRYYWRQSASSTAGDYTAFGLGWATTTTNANFVIKTPSTMRIKPSAIEFSTLMIGEGSSAISVSNAYIVGSASPDQFVVGATVSGATQYRPYYLGANNSTSAYVAASAEL
jgi:hypothetical protein